MATIADELNAISVEHGYTGAAPKTIAGAIDALADTLAGTDVEERRTIAGAVKALAPYIGGGGGAALGEVQAAPAYKNGVPSIGDNMNDYGYFNQIILDMGQTRLVDGCTGFSGIASGITVTQWFSQVRGAYVVMYQVDPLTGTATVTDVTPFENYSYEDEFLSFTMPALPTREETDGKDCLLVFDTD